MFEALLERILLAKLGKYIEGLDRENLKIAVWSGDIILENVHLKTETLLMLQLPLILHYSRVSRLEIRIPWLQLGSSPVEINLQGVFAIVTPQQKNTWNYSEDGEILRRKEHIAANELRWKQLQEQKTLSAEEELKQKSYLEKLASRIIDNLKVTIEDIHFRFEHNMDGRRFSSGLTLEKVECYTTNQYWNKEYTDRQQEGSAGKSIYKLLNIVGLGIYWKNDDDKILSQLSSENEIIEALKKRTYECQINDYLILPINATTQIIHNGDLTQLDKPRYAIDVAMPEIYTKFHQKQFHDIVKVCDYLAEYNKFILKAENKKKFVALSPIERTPRSLLKFGIECVLKTVKQRKNRAVDLFKIPKDLKDFYESNYKLLHLKLKKEGSLSPEKTALYNRIIFITPLEELRKWTDQVLSVLDKEEKEKVENSKKRGWMSYIWGGPETTKEKDDEAYEQIFGESIQEWQPSEVSKSYVWLEFEFRLQKGSLELCKYKKGSGEELESLEFRHERFLFKIALRTPGGDLCISAQSISIISVTSEGEKIVCQKLQENTLPLALLAISLKPESEDVAASVEFQSQPFEVNFNPDALCMFCSFFIVPNVADATKAAAWDTLQEFQDSTQETLTDLLYGETKYILKIHACGPRITLPSPTGQGKFILNLGEAEIYNEISEAEGLYEEFYIHISNISFLHSLDFINFTPVVPSFEINTSLDVLKSRYKKRKWEKNERQFIEVADLVMSGSIPVLRVILSPSIYNQILRLGEIFKLDDEVWSTIILEKRIIMRKAVTISKLKKKNASIQSWHHYFAVLSAGYIYFFNNEKETLAANYYYIKDCSVVDISDQIGIPNTLKLLNRFGECVIAFDKPSEMKKWMEKLNDQITELMTYTSAAAKDPTPKANKLWCVIDFSYPEISLKLSNEEGAELAEFELNELSMKGLLNTFDLGVHATLESLNIKDLQRNSPSIHFNYFVRTLNEDKGLMDFKFQYISRASLDYNDTDVVSMASFGTLQINWNPDIIGIILNFFAFARYSDPSSVVSALTHQQTLGKLQSDHVLFNLSLKIEKLDLYLNNVQKELCIALVSIQNTDTAILIRNGGSEFSGFLGNLLVDDLTNYPKTAVSNHRYLYPFTLLSVRDSSQFLLKFKICMYSEDNPDKPLDTSTIVNIEMNSINMVYIQQPFLRIIDYFSYKILGVFDVNARARDINHWSPLYRLSYLLNLSTIQSLQEESGLFQDTRSFTSMTINIKNPHITLTPRPDYPDYLIVDLGDINITNKHGISTNRGDEVWLDIYTIFMKNVNISSKTQDIADKLDFLLTFERPVLTNLQQLNRSIDKSFIIRGESHEVKLTFSQNDYKTILKLVDLNLSYDDQMEEYINPECVPPLKIDNLPDHGGVFINLNIDIGLFALLLNHKDQEIAEIVGTRTNIKMIKYNDYSMDMGFTCKGLLGLIDKIKVSSETNNETRLSQEIFTIPSHCQSILEGNRLSHVLFGPLEEDNELSPIERESTFRLDLKSSFDGSKDIIIELIQVRINFHYAIIMEIQNFFYYGMPDYTDENDTPFDYMHKYRPSPSQISKEVLLQWLAPKLMINVCIKKPIVILPCLDTNRVLVAQTDFNYMMMRENEAKAISGEVPSAIKKFVAHELELYTCKPDELVSKKSFENVKKRRIQEPLQLIFASVEQRVEDRMNYDTDWQIENLTLIISHQDINLIASVMKFQNEMLEREAKLIKELEIAPKRNTQKIELPKAPVNKSRMRGRTDCERETLPVNPAPISLQNLKISSKTNYYFGGINVLIINDGSGAYSPVIDFTISQFKLKQDQNGDEYNIKAELDIRSSYYNPFIDMWEPFIEMFILNVEVFDSPNLNPQKQVMLLFNPSLPFNINLTEIMIKHTLKILSSWSTSEQRVEGKEVVSPLCVINKTGCNMQAWKTNIMDTSPKIIIEVPAGKSVDYEINANDMRTIEISQEFLTVSLFKPEMPFPPINNIPINKVQCLTVDVDCYGQQFPIILEIGLIETRKILTVRSSIVILNETTFDIKLLFSKFLESEEKICPAKQECSVPIDFVNHLLGFMPVDSDIFEWTMIRLQEFSSQNHGHSAEIKIGNSHVELYLIRDLANPQKKTIAIKPPTIIRNHLPCDLSMRLYYQNKHEYTEIFILAGQTYEEYAISSTKDLHAAITFRNFSYSNRQCIISRRGDKPATTITFIDNNGDAITVLIDYRKEGSHMITLYSAVVLVNNTSLPVTFYSKKKGHSKIVAGQNNIDPLVPCFFTKKIAIGMGKSKSEYFKINTIGAQTMIEIEGEPDEEGLKTKYQFIYEVQLVQSVPNELIFTRMVIVSPRFLLVNNMKQDLIIKQFKSPSKDVILKPESREPFHWPDCMSNELMNIKVLEDHWGWSGAFSISSVGTFTVQCRNLKDPGVFVLIKVEIKLQTSTAYIVFEEENERFCSYRIENFSKNISMMVYQQGCKDEMRYIDVMSMTPFAFSKPLLDHELVVEFFIGSLEDFPVQTNCKYRFSFDKINLTYRVPILMTQELGYVIFGITISESATKVLRFADVPLGKITSENEMILTQFNINIPRFGISFIEHYHDKAAEVLYFSANNITLLMQTTKRQWKVEMLIETLQIDNQYNPSAIFPVLIFPNEYNENRIVHLSICAYIDENPNCDHFETFELLIQPLTINLESAIIRKLMEYIGRLTMQESPVYESQKIYEAYFSPTWSVKEPITQDKRFYFAKLKLCPIKLILTFVPLKETEETANDAFATITKALGMAITAIESAPIKLYSVEMNDLFGTQMQIVSGLLMHYKGQLASEIFSLIGHAEVLGNPIGLLNNLGTGFVDFFYEPAQGLINGPMSAGKGFIKGAGSLVKNTVQGTFGTVSKLASSLATGISSLTQSREYFLERQRDKIKNKPRNLVDGVGLGFKSFFRNLGKGITGVVSEPYKGYKKNKVKGMIKGGVRGLTGLVVKPVAGMLDAASKTAEGVKNTANAFEKVSVYNRARAPRPFYGNSFLIKPYNEYDAQSLFFINQLQKGIYSRERFIAQSVSKDIRGQKLLAILFFGILILADIRTKKILWEVNTSTIENLEVIERKGLVLYTLPSKHKKHKKKVSFLIPFPNQAAVDKLSKKIKDVMAQIKS
ncbi:VPS13_2 [Blepharisma stoltei]|uniref:PH domain-containing protein n=1 Tax=Blepharisma stoltei TaxID=1481888 RepID=A0AAU9K724_9CILI|nr:unnamed protein product [Blepharisma stoltei]